MSDNNSRQGRQLRSTPQQFCTRDDGDDLIIEGYFAVFDSPYVLWDGATEIVKPGAFAGCLSGDIRALIDKFNDLRIDSVDLTAEFCKLGFFIHGDAQNPS